MAIKPLNLPTAAGLDYGNADVRHFSEGDDQSATALSNPTRHLAYRDVQLAQKVNELVEFANNREQFVPLALVRTTVPGGTEIPVLNYRIPEGFEARILNAAVTSLPVSTDVELLVYYSAGFGGATGSAVVTTSTEFTGSVQMYSEGEFIVALKNKGSVPLEMVPSLLLTVRPLGATGSLLVASVVQGDPGLPGIQGATGPAGPTSTAVAGTAGLRWRGPWSNLSDYDVGDVVSRTNAGITSSYVGIVGSDSGSPQDPLTATTYWELLAQGSAGADGADGSDGAAGTQIPVFESQAVDASLETGSDVVSTSIDEYETLAPSQTYPISLSEQFIGISGDTEGCAFLFGAFKANITGSGTLTLPKALDGAKVDYSASLVHVVAAVNGTVPVETVELVDQTRLVTCNQTDVDKYTLKVLSADPVRVTVSVFGAQLVP